MFPFFCFHIDTIYYLILHRLSCESCEYVHTPALHFRSILPEVEPSTTTSNALYMNTNNMSAPQLSSSMTQTCSAFSGETTLHGKDLLCSMKGSLSEVDSPHSDDQPVTSTLALNTPRQTVGRFSIGPVKEATVHTGR